MTNKAKEVIKRIENYISDELIQSELSDEEYMDVIKGVIVELRLQKKEFEQFCKEDDE